MVLHCAVNLDRVHNIFWYWFIVTFLLIFFLKLTSKTHPSSAFYMTGYECCFKLLSVLFLDQYDYYSFTLTFIISKRWPHAIFFSKLNKSSWLCIFKSNKLSYKNAWTMLILDDLPRWTSLPLTVTDTNGLKWSTNRLKVYAQKEQPNNRKSASTFRQHFSDRKSHAAFEEHFEKSSWKCLFRFHFITSQKKSLYFSKSDAI